MPTTKKRSPGRPAKVASKSNSRKTSKLSAGTYTVPRGHVSIAVPAFWTLRQTNEDLEVEAPSGATSVIVTAFQRNGHKQKLDAREYLEHFLETAPENSRMKRDRGTKQRARARYKDGEGDHWEVAFVTDGATLLLATCNTSFPTTNKEAKTGFQVLDSVTIRKK
ncbi:MAG TPA: hypothetical protein VFU86_11910 [Terriglobales bacterium]|nr:hypothetical protein [Terriglobales bacterium]